MPIKKLLLTTLIILAAFVADLSSASTKPSEEEINNIFSSAESLFKAMELKDYTVIWQSLTVKSQQRIVDAVYRAIIKKGIDTQKDIIRKDFIEGGEIAKAYWDNYLEAFNPNIVINQSKWTFKTLKSDSAEIDILYKKSSNPATLKLNRENNTWKVGLEETFGARNLIPFK